MIFNRPSTSAHRTTEAKPLGQSVTDSIDAYFNSLNGNRPTELYSSVLDQIEPPLLRATLRYCDNNQSKAADMLGLNRATLRKKLRQHKIGVRLVTR